MKAKIAITGSNGIIGTVLKKGLQKDNYEITSIDLPQVDVTDYPKLLKAVKNRQAIIHLAWDSQAESFRNGKTDPDNSKMFLNVYHAALEAKVPRVIMASSIHADGFYKWKGKGFMSPYKSPTPDSAYGEDKVFMERAGQYFATKGLEVVCIRFGGINPANKPPVGGYPKDIATWLSHKDCVSLIDSIIQAKEVPNNFAIVYAVSNNKGRIVDITNPFGWTPKEKAE